MVSDIKIRNMYSQKLQNKISKIIDGLQVLSKFNNIQMGGNIGDIKNKYSNKINNKLNEFVKNSNILLNFDRTITQYGGKSTDFTNDAISVDVLKEKLSALNKNCEGSLKVMSDELKRLELIEVEFTKLENEIKEHTQIKTNLENSVQEKATLVTNLENSSRDKDTLIAQLQAQINAGVTDQSAIDGLNQQISKLNNEISELQAKIKESEKVIQMLDEKDTKTVKELQDLTEKYNKVKESRDEIFKKNKETILKYQEKLELADNLFDKYEKCSEGITEIAKPIVTRNNFSELPGSV